MKNTSGVILFAHGSRDPQWRQPIEAVAMQLTTQHPEIAVACAYLELSEPSLPAVVDDWAAQGIQSISIVPMFLGAGRHVREDLPRMAQELRDRHPRIALQLQTLIGEDPRLTDMMAQIAADSVQQG